MRSSASYNDPNGDKTHVKAAPRGSGSRRRPVMAEFRKAENEAEEEDQEAAATGNRKRSREVQWAGPRGVPQPDLMEESLTEFNVRDGLGVG